MAIRDRFRRMRNSVSSTTTSQTESNSDSSEPKSPLRLTKTFTWRSSPKEGKKDKPAKDPRERPFTETNLKHQELLSAFTMTFGRRRTSSGARSSFGGGVSPGTSRQASLDRGSRDPEAYRRHSSALAPGVKRVDPVAEEDIKP